MRLYDIANEFVEIRELLESGEIDADAAKDTLDAVSVSFEDKLRNCLMIMREFESTASALEVEIGRIKSLQQSAEKSAESLKQYVSSCMEMAGNDKADLGLFKVTLKAPSKAVEIADESALPEDYFVVVPETKRPDKSLISKALKDGFDVPGAKLVDGKRALLIK